MTKSQVLLWSGNCLNFLPRESPGIYILLPANLSHSRFSIMIPTPHRITLQSPWNLPTSSLPYLPLPSPPAGRKKVEKGKILFVFVFQILEFWILILRGGLDLWACRGFGWGPGQARASPNPTLGRPPRSLTLKLRFSGHCPILAPRSWHVHGNLDAYLDRKKMDELLFYHRPSSAAKKISKRAHPKILWLSFHESR